MANAVAAALEALEMPLDEQQAMALGVLAGEFVARDERRLAGYEPDPGNLAKMCDEAELKHEFFGKVYGLLSDAQHESLREQLRRLF